LQKEYIKNDSNRSILKPDINVSGVKEMRLDNLRCPPEDKKKISELLKKPWNPLSKAH
jgi:hypothetical protein